MLETNVPRFFLGGLSVIGESEFKKTPFGPCLLDKGISKVAIAVVVFVLILAAAFGLSIDLPTKDRCLSRKGVATVVATEFDGLAFETLIAIGVGMRLCVLEVAVAAETFAGSEAIDVVD